MNFKHIKNLKSLDNSEEYDILLHPNDNDIIVYLKEPFLIDTHIDYDISDLKIQNQKIQKQMKSILKSSYDQQLIQMIHLNGSFMKRIWKKREIDIHIFILSYDKGVIFLFENYTTMRYQEII